MLILSRKSGQSISIGADVTVTGHPLAIAPGYAATVAKSKKLSYHDYGLQWEISEKNGFFSPFAYQAG